MDFGPDANGASQIVYAHALQTNLFNRYVTVITGGTAISQALANFKNGALESLVSGGSPYVLPVASETTLGSVKRGKGITVGPDGTLSTNSDRVYLSKWSNTPDNFMQAITTSAADDYQYYPLRFPYKVSEVLPDGAAGTNPSTGVFIAPVHGFYDVRIRVGFQGGDVLSGESVVLGLTRGSGNVKPVTAGGNQAVIESNFNSYTFTELVELAEGEQIRLLIGIITAGLAGRIAHHDGSAVVMLTKFLS